MPHSATAGLSNREKSLDCSADFQLRDERDGRSSLGVEKFPDFDHGLTNGRASTPQTSLGHAAGSGQPGDRWQPRRDSRLKWGFDEPTGHGLESNRQRRISNAIQRIRSGSMSHNAHEIADALRAPVSYKLIVLCLIWYWSSALTNTSSKTILTTFDKPATLTLVQFAFVSSYCLFLSWLASVFPGLRSAIPALRHPIRRPSRDVIMTTLPLAGFQIGGHLLSSSATSKIPVSLVHTIKGLSPLFTVLAYRFIFNIRYPRATYLSLIPLTVGVMLACSGSHTFRGEFLGILYALVAAIIFVTQNIFSKRLFNEAAIAEHQGSGAQFRKLDKLNLLCYSSGLAFIITVPIWFWTEGVDLIGDFLWNGSVDLTETPNSVDHGRLMLEFIFNGTFHFGQNILAFILLSMVSPVTYSVASLIKRVFVVVIAIIWFRSPTTRVQAIGIALTFLGLYLYDRSNEKNKADQRARSLTETRSDRPLLPLTSTSPHPSSVFESSTNHGLPSQPYNNGTDNKKLDDFRPGMNGNATWLPPGTKQEETWRVSDAGPARI
ncbi:hypothetical protein VTK73DRAFT_118 [Phialemonium thermophilum]|uniref:Sugar phosphate transporter domain-containing protein n=1 Tax=Phialemonium thermophilum TaxID=223376 RepID=A0ABR3Y405_9PEZI